MSWTCRNEQLLPLPFGLWYKIFYQIPFLLPPLSVRPPTAIYSSRKGTAMTCSSCLSPLQSGTFLWDPLSHMQLSSSWHQLLVSMEHLVCLDYFLHLSERMPLCGHSSYTIHSFCDTDRESAMFQVLAALQLINQMKRSNLLGLPSYFFSFSNI